MPDRVVVFVDYQNVYSTARGIFHDPTEPPSFGQVWPIALGDLIVARRPRESVLHQVRIYRGLPDVARQPAAAAANDRQADAWGGDPRVVIYRRPRLEPPVVPFLGPCRLRAGA